MLDRDRDAIVAAHGREPKNAMVAQRPVADLDEAGPHEDTVAYARLGFELDGPGWDQKLVTFVVADAVTRGALDEAVELRRAWFSRFPLSSAFATLRESAKLAGVWDVEQPAEQLLAERDPNGFTRYLLDEGRGQEAWDFASSHFEPGSSADAWMALCAARVAARPADTLPDYREVVQRTLEVIPRV